LLNDAERLAHADIRLLESFSSKFKALSPLLDRLVKVERRRVVLYTQMDAMIPVLEYFMSLLNLPAVTITGSISNQHKALAHFALKDPVRVAIVSTRTRNAGTNRAACIYGAQAVIVIDSDWDPMCEAKLRASWQLLATTQDLQVFFCNIYRLQH